MNVSVKSEGEVSVITIAGSIDSNTAPALQQQVMAATSETNKVIMDLSNVSFVSSAGLRVLLMVYRLVKSKSGKVILVGVSEEIEGVMSMTGFINFFVLTATLQEALNKF